MSESVVNHTHSWRLADHDASSSALVAEMAGLRARNARLAARSAMLAALARVLNQTGADEAGLLRVLSTTLAEQLGLASIIGLVGSDGQLAAASWYHSDPEVQAGLEAIFAHAPWDTDAPPIRPVMNDGENLTLTTTLIEQIQKMDDHTWPILSQLGISSMIATPLRTRGRIFGIIALASFASDQIEGEEDIAFLQQVADSAALAIDNARLLSELQQELQERQRTEDELKASANQLVQLNTELQHGRDLLSAVFDGLEDGLILLDRSGSLLAINQRLASLFGRQAGDLIGRSWRPICRDLPSFLVTSVSASLSDAVPRHGRVRIQGCDEHSHIFDFQTLPLFDNTKGMSQLVVHLHDVTEHVQLDAQLVAQERFAANGRLAATVAHEVSTPLQAIESCLHMAGRVDDTERARYLRIAREEIKRIGYTLRQLLDLYRADRNAGPIDLNALIERVLLLTGSSIGRQGVQIERHLASELPAIIGHADELTQVLINLIVNAQQSMPRGGVLRVETNPTCLNDGRSGVLARIHDTGPGIPIEIQEQIFEPFFTTRAEGTGLGLAISRRIMEAHGGRIDLQSNSDQGSVFSLIFPV